MVSTGHGQSYGTHDLSGGAGPPGGVGGFCGEFLLAEIEEAIAQEHPEMKRGDVFELVQEWLRAVDDPLH